MVKTMFFIIMALAAAIAKLPAQTAEQFIADAEKYAAASDDIKEAEMYYRAGLAAWESGSADLAVECLEKAVVVNHRLGNKNALHNIYGNIGTILADANKLESSLLYMRKSLMLKKAQGDPVQHMHGLFNIVPVLNLLGRHYEAIGYAEEGLAIAKQTNNLRSIRTAYGHLAESHKEAGESAKSMEYFNLYATFDRRISAEEDLRRKAEASVAVEQAKQLATDATAQKKEAEVKAKKVTQTLESTEKNLYQAKLRASGQDALIKLKNTELEQKKAQELQQRLMKRIFGAGLAASVAVLAALILFFAKLRAKNRQITKQRELIEKKNRDISNSLAYAKKIQKAMLPPQHTLSSLLEDSFIMFRPREEVSGDFYYFTSLDTPCDILVSAIDCTGHGVPGAFMSMIGNNIIDQIVGSGVSSPDKILENLHHGVIKALKQNKTDNKDGMDMSMVKINKPERKILFAGAKNPLVYIAGGELVEIKGSRSPIGGTMAKLEAKFPLTEIICTEPTCVYLYSDGFQDQFGGQAGNKYMAKRFKQFLMSIHNLPMDEQKQKLEIELQTWMCNGQKQIDDILIIGFRL
jgi:serine phosphatase RsbU (regulator of sigma subunit)